MQGYKMYCYLNGGYSFVDYVDHKKDGKISKNIKNIFNRYYKKRLRRRIKRFNCGRCATGDEKRIKLKEV